MSAPAFYLNLIPAEDLVYFPILRRKNIFQKKHLLPLRFWSCHLTWSVTMPTWICNMYHTIQNVWLWWINHQSQSMTQMPVICHCGNILIALWCNSYSREICFTIGVSVLSKTPQRWLSVIVLRIPAQNISLFNMFSDIKSIQICISVQPQKEYHQPKCMHITISTFCWYRKLEIFYIHHPSKRCIV